MQYKIIVDKQSSANPSEEKREYIIDIEELRFLKDVYDTLVITKDEDYVMRRLSLSEYGVLKVLETPVKEPLQNVNIQLFEGDNYIYIQDMSGNKFYAEYLVKNDFTDMYVTVNQMNSAITQTAGQIELTVNQKLKEYATTEELEGAVTELNSTITQKADEINVEVSKKVNDEDLTGANIMLKINGDSSEAQINADKININGAISANGNFKVDTNGNMECTNGKFNGGEVKIQGGTRGEPNIAILDSENKVSAYLAENSLGIEHNGSETWAYIEATENVVSFNMVKDGSSDISMHIDNTDAMITLLGPSGSSTTIADSYIITPELIQISKEESKKNFEKLENGLNIIKQTDIYKYNLKNEDDTTKKHIGFVIGDDYNYSKEITSNKNDGVDIYSFVAVCCKAIQEQQEQIQELTEKVKRLEGANEEN